MKTVVCQWTIFLIRRLHLSILQTQVSSTTKRTGTICILNFEGITNGDCILTIDKAELVFMMKLETQLES